MSVAFLSLAQAHCALLFSVASLPDHPLAGAMAGALCTKGPAPFVPNSSWKQFLKHNCSLRKKRRKDGGKEGGKKEGKKKESREERRKLELGSRSEDFF